MVSAVVIARRLALLFVASAGYAQSVDGRLADSVSHEPISGVGVTLLGPGRYNDNHGRGRRFPYRDESCGSRVVSGVAVSAPDSLRYAEV